MSTNLKLATAFMMVAFAGTAFATTSASADTKKTCVDSTTKSQRVHCGKKKRRYLRQFQEGPVVNFRARNNLELANSPVNGGDRGRGGNRR